MVKRLLNETRPKIKEPGATTEDKIVEVAAKTVIIVRGLVKLAIRGGATILEKAMEEGSKEKQD